MVRRRSVALVGLLGLTGALIGGLPAAAAPVKWTTCPAGEVVDRPLVLVECAKVPVPLDYGEPGGTKIELTISRIAGTAPEKRRGVLLFNPGGPGGSGLDQPGLMVSQGLPKGVLDAYDLIGINTRGVGDPAVSCGFQAADYYGNIPPYAPDDAAVTKQAAIVKEIAERCAANDKGDRLRHLTTANTARDLDRIRAVLGEPKASFFGASYGSALGAAYASMFPGTADRIVLDSIVGDTHLDRDGLRRFGRGMEETFVDFAKWAAARHESFGLGRTPQQVRRTYLATAERLDQAPAADGTTGAQFRNFIFVGLYNKVSYGNVARIWQTYKEAPPAPEPAPAPEGPAVNDNALTVFLAVTCNDIAWPEDVATYRRAVAEDRKRYPLFGPAAANILPCASWKHEPAEPPVAIVDDGPRNVLILQNRLDPVTPFKGGQVLRGKFAQRSKLVTVDGSGHGVYVLGGNACALNLTTAYLVDGTMPGRDVNCRRD